MVALLAAAVAVTLAASACGGSAPSTGASPAAPDPSLVAAEMAAAMSSLSTLHATTSYEASNGRAGRGTFMCDAAGSYSIASDDLRATAEAQRTDTAWPLSSTYDSGRHRLMDTYRRPGGRLDCVVFDDAWPFEEPMGAPGGGGFRVGEVWRVRAALAEADPAVSVEETLFEGRPAWRMVDHHGERADGEIPVIDRLVIDRQTGFPVAFEAPGPKDGVGGDAAYRLTLTDLRVDEPLPRGAFRAAPPPGARLYHVVAADYYCRLGEVAARVGFRPLTPSRASVPADFRLREVATTDRGPMWLRGWCEPDSREPHRDQFLRYRRGLDSFTIQIAVRRGVPRRLITDSPGIAALAAGTGQRRVLARGPFAGETAHTWLDDRGANLIVVGERYTAFITGALTRAELYELAEGLR